MAEAAAVIGLVSSIASLVDLSVKVVSRVNEFASQASEVPQSFRSLANRLPLLLQTLQQIQARAQAGQVGDDIVKQLYTLVNDLLDHVAILQRCLDGIVPAVNASRKERLLKSLQSLAKDEKVRKVMEEVHHGIDVLNLHQSTTNVEIGDRIFQKLAQLELEPTFTPPQQQQQQQKFGLCLGQAPQIDPDAFMGRATEVRTLHGWLTPENHTQTQKVVSIVGMGGLGKTQLSLAYAREHGHHYSSVFWLNAKDRSSLRQSIFTLYKTIFPDVEAVSSSVDNEDRQIEGVRRWLSETSNHTWLMIFDNYDDPSLPNVRSSTGYDIRSFFPTRAQGSIIITTRFPRLTFTKRLVLQKFNDVDLGVAILSQRSGQDISQDEHARRLTVRLDGLPLALATVGTYLGQTDNTCAEYLEAYESTWADLHGPDTESLFEYEDRTLSSMWTISLNHVSRQDEDAAELFRFFAFTSNQDIWYDLIYAGAKQGPKWLERVTTTKGRFDRAMAKLRDYGLVEVVSGSYYIHPCVHDWLLEHSTSSSEASFLTALRCIMGNVLDQSQMQYWTTNRRLTDHIERLYHPRFRTLWETFVSNKTVLNACDAFGGLYRAQGRHDLAEQMYTRALVGKEQALGEKHISTLATVNNLGILYFTQGKLDEAYQMWRRALTGAEQALGREHLLTLNIINNLSRLHCADGKHDDAEQMWMQALAGTEKALGPEHARTLNIVNNLGMLYHTQGKLEEAEQTWIQALVKAERALGREHPLTLTMVNNLGVLYHNQGKLDLTEQMHKRALAGKEQILGREHPSTINTVNHLGDLYREQNSLVEMIKLVSTYGDRSIQLFGLLGRMLLQSSDESNAQTAFQQQVKFENDIPMFANIVCDGCQQSIPCVRKRYICKRCKDIDLCGECWTVRSTKADEIAICKDHTFLEISMLMSCYSEQDQLSQLHDRELWLQDLTAKYLSQYTRGSTKQHS